MALLEISYDDFDTTCYSVQHNLIQLINHAVSIGVQVNINTGDIESVKNTAEEAGQEGHDAMLLATNLNTRTSALETRMTAIWENNPLFQTSKLAQRIDELEDRIVALGG